MRRFEAVLMGLVVFLLLGGPLLAQSEPVVATWGNYLVVTAPADGNSPRDVATRNQLHEQRTTFSFRGTPFSEAVEFLSTVSALNIVIDHRAGVADVPMTLSLKDVSVATALSLLTRQADVSWKVRDGVVLIGHKEDLVGPMRTSVHDVTDLLAVAPDFKGPTIELQVSKPTTQETPLDPFRTTTQTGPKKTQDETEKSRQEMMKELAQIVEDMLKSGTWEESMFP